MSELDDHDLLALYARESSELAFSALVSRYLNLVYSVALRKTADAGAAEEIAQAVFIVLAKKAGGLSRRVVLSGWLYHTTRLTAANYVRSEIRRQKREQEAFMQIDDAETWQNIAPLLEDAMATLGEKDRDAVVLRFFENKSLREVGQALGASEDAAKMRVNRALAHLRKIFGKRGFTLSTAAIVGAVSAHSVQAAPVALAKTISTVAIAQGAAAGGTTLALVKGGLKLMAWTKMQTAAVTAAVVLLTAGTAAVAVKEIQDHRTYPWQVSNANSETLRKAPPQAAIAPAKYPGTRGAGIVTMDEGKVLGISQSFEEMVGHAYEESLARTIFPKTVPSGLFDFIANLRSRNNEALQNEIRRRFGLSGRRETRNADVLLLQVQNAHAAGLQLADPGRREGNSQGSWQSRPGYFSGRNQPLDGLKWYLEYHFKIPVINQTGLTNQFDIELKWDEADYHHPNMESLAPVLLDQLGLVLVPTNMPIEMLVVDKGG